MCMHVHACLSEAAAAMSNCTWIRKGLDIAKLPRVKLNNIQDLPGAKKKAIRVGRGPGSRKGKTCGRGHKGQGQRNKHAIKVGFEGGTMPFYLSVPKHGFKNKFQIRYEPLNLSRLQYLIDTGRLDASKPIKMDSLHSSGAVGKIEHGVKLLGDGAEWFKAKVDIEVSKASSKAIDAVERQGGRVVSAYYNRLGLRVLLKPEKFKEGLVPRRALPNKKLMPYYLDPKNRGYLAVTEEGKARLKEGGMEGAYLGPDGFVHIPGKRVTLYSEPSPTKEEMEQEEDDGGDEENRAESILRSLSTKCTKLLLGYWAYELCHWKHIRQYHEPVKKTTGYKDLDEYYLGRYSSSEGRNKKVKSLPSASETDVGAESSDDKVDSTASTATATTTKKSQREDIPVWYYNGHEYPYYEVEMTGGTPCDLKGDQPRSVLIRYICDMNSHPSGTFLDIEEVTTCKYEGVVSTSNLCQNRAYRLRENPVHNVKCYAKDGSPSKPTTLLEHEITILKQMQGSLQKSGKSSKKRGREVEVEEEGGEVGGGGGGEEGMGDYPSDSGVNREPMVALDETFVQSFLSGELCLRGGSGWWQHELCYGKYVKQIHEEAGKDPVELLLGVWLEEGHKRWFSSAGQRKQSNNHVIHLYMNGDVCDVTKVARQCQVKFRCSKSARQTQISLFLEEPTTCNYVLTVEAAFLCTLVKHTDPHGNLVYLWAGQKGGVSGQAKVGKRGEDDVDVVLDDVNEGEYDDDGNLKPVDGNLEPESNNFELDPDDLESEWDSENQMEEEEEEEEEEGNGGRTSTQR